MVKQPNRDFIILGHRGCIGVDGIGENTVPAFARALQDGADGIEFDVYAARDTQEEEHLVVMHDDDVRRTTNGTGNVWDLGYERIRALKVGDEKTESPDQYEEVVPTAEEVLDVVIRFNRAMGRRALINVELKGRDTAELTARLIRAYSERGLNPSDFLVSSFDHPQLVEFRDLSPEIPTAVLIDSRQFAAAGESLGPAIALAHQLGSVAVNTGLSFTGKDDVRRLHREGLKSYIWTGASQEMVDKANEHVVQIYQLGADGAFANDPGGGRRALGATSST